MAIQQLSTSQLVNEKFADSRSYASNAFLEANTLLNSLADIIPQVSFPYVDTNIPITTYDPILEEFKYTPPTIDWPSNGTVSRPALKDIPELGITAPALITPSITGSVVEPTEVSISDIPVVVKPSLPVFRGSTVFPDFNVTGVVNQIESILNNLQNNIVTVGNVILNFITNPQQAIGDDLVNSMTLVAMQKIDDGFQSKYTEVSTYFSSRGWDIPQGIMVGKLTEIDRAHSVQRSLVHENILIKNFELSQQNFLAALQAYIQYVQENNAISANTVNTLFSSLKYAHELVTIELNAFISMYQADSEVFKTDLGAQIQIANMTIEKNKAVIAQYSTQVQAFAAKIAAISSYNQDLVKKMEAEIAAYGANIQGLSSSNTEVIKAYSADIQKYMSDVQAATSHADVVVKLAANELSAFDVESKFEVSKAQIKAANSGLLLDAKKTEVQLTLGEVESNIKNMLAVSSLTVEIAKSAATIASQLAASSMSAVSAGATLAYHEAANYDMTKDTVETRINLSGSV